MRDRLIRILSTGSGVRRGGRSQAGGLETAAPCSTPGTSVLSVSFVVTPQPFNRPRMKNSAGDSGRYNRFNASTNHRGETSLRRGEADYLLFRPDGECAFCRRQEGFLDVFLGAGNKIAAATQVELALNVFAMALNRFHTET